MSARVEAYSKDYDNLRPRYENALDALEIITEGLPDRIMISPDSAEARGIEFLLKQNSNPVFNWWVGYALSEVYDTIDGVVVLRSWAQRHAVNTMLNWRWQKWNWNLSGTYHTGWPTTAIGLPGESIADREMKQAIFARREPLPTGRFSRRVLQFCLSA